MKIFLVCLLFIVLLGCSPTPPTPLTGVPITGIDRFKLGDRLSESDAPGAEADGSFHFDDSRYTNLPPFDCLLVSADPQRRIYDISLMTLHSDDPERARMLADQLSQKYGGRQERDTDRERTISFGSYQRYGTFTQGITNDDLSLSFSDRALQYAEWDRVALLESNSVARSLTNF